MIKPEKVVPKKRFGQHFLTDASDLRFIADAAEVRAGETVLEIGPGLGALTGPLLDKGLRVAAVEKDRALAAHLRVHFKDRALQVFTADILSFDVRRELAPEAPVAVFGNIPYNITSPILFWLIEQRPWVRQAVLTTQWEVAARLAGKPGHEAWGAVSVSVQAYADVRFLRKIPKGHFHPAPKVDSAVIRLDFFDRPRFDEAHRTLFHAIVARAFQKRRKTLLNALDEPAAGRDKRALLEAFSEAGLDPKRRPETLAVSEWVSLARILSR